ncbi:MAG: hypothetical protein ACRC67_14275 [Inquilinus sp.]|uniref:hypothetical protein n=1 Tax=Inquilinus sp. TaxID=1932117 RepID=UPI003F2A713F
MPKPHRSEDAASLSRNWKPFRIPLTVPAVALVNGIIVEIMAEEGRTRQRRRRDADVPNFKRTIGAIVADLAHRLLEIEHDPSDIRLPGVRLTLRTSKLGRKARRYDPPFLGKTLPTILDTMARCGLVTVEKGEWSGSDEPGKLTIVRPTLRLAEMLTQADLQFPDWGLCVDQEIIMQRSANDDPQHKGALVDYADDANTTGLREEVRRINDHLRHADITVLKDDPALARINPALRFVQRVFNQSSFDHGGRLGGAQFWTMLHRHERSAVRIDGHPVATVDYSSMGTRLLYAEAGVLPPDGDHYDLDGFGPAYRDAVKRFASGSLFVKGRPLHEVTPRRPSGLRFGLHLETLPYGTTMGALTTAWERRHAGLRWATWGQPSRQDEEVQQTGWLYRGLGHRLFRRESDILVRVLLTLNAQGITALPLHDAVLVARPHAEVARSVMQSTYLEATGQPIPVSVD